LTFFLFFFLSFSFLAALEGSFAPTDGLPKQRERKVGHHKPLGDGGALAVSNDRRYRWHSAVMHVVQSSSQPSHCFEPCVST